MKSDQVDAVRSKVNGPMPKDINRGTSYVKKSVFNKNQRIKSVWKKNLMKGENEIDVGRPKVKEPKPKDMNGGSS